ncbi:MAG: hypothetical protein LIP01_03055 [Tannerellaceae bacterium]|nr:hypothetical protein [Tannerellaceae bacterium]
MSCLNYTNNQLYYSIRDSIYIWDNSASSSQFVFAINQASLQVQKIVCDSKQNVWIGTRTGLYKRDNTQTITCVLPDLDIYDIYEDSKNRLWITTFSAGIFLLTTENIENFSHNPLDPTSISSNQVRCFMEDNYGTLWIGAFTGLNKFNPETRQFKNFARELLPGSLNHSSVFSLYKDKQGTIWTGTYYGGVHYFNPETDLFTLYSDNPLRRDCLSYPFVGNMVEDVEGNIWICTEGGGLNFFNRKTKTFKHYMADGISSSIAHNNLKSISYSPEHQKLFIGTHTGGLSVFDIQKKQFQNVSQLSPSYPSRTGDMVVNDVGLYNKDTLLFITQRGLYKMDIPTHSITPFYENGKQITGFGFCIDSQKNIWVKGGQTVNKIRLHEPEKNTQFYCNQKGLGNFPITTIFEDRKGQIFFGTLGSGLFRYQPETDNFIAYQEEEGTLQSNYCYSIQQPIQGYILISGNKGLTFLDPESSGIKTVDLSTALPIEGINSGCGLLVCKNGEIFVGGTNGFTSFFEQELFNAPKKYNLFFTRLSINNEKSIPPP